MTLTFPLSASAFFAGLRVAECRFYLPDMRQISRDRGGAQWDSQMAERLWAGEIMLARAYHSDAAAIEAVIDVLTEAGASFMAHPLPLWAPMGDPGGVILGTAAPELHSIASNRRDIRIEGLPAGYRLSPGDFVGLTYGTPVRYALHRVVEATQADVAGLTPAFEVRPPVRAGTYADAVTLVRPAIRAKLLPVAEAPTSRTILTEGRTLRFVQHLGD
jgi:hypothetical protein